VNDRASVERLRQLGLSGRYAMPVRPLMAVPTIAKERTADGASLRRERVDLLNEIDRLKYQRRLLQQDIYRLTKRKERLEKWMSSRPAINAKARAGIVTRCKQRCAYCKKAGDDTRGPDGRPWHIDHIVPFSEGGPTIPSNLTLACATCNISKGTKFLLLQVVAP
jgi:5-methylcytosine-specific restriction endonuclease McrA